MHQTLSSMDNDGASADIVATVIITAAAVNNLDDVTSTLKRSCPPMLVSLTNLLY
jgi:hypothetical protein